MNTRDIRALPVLVLDGDMNAGLAIVRSLGRKGIAVEVAAVVDDAISRYSRFANQFHVHPDPLTDEGGFLDWLKQTCSDQRYSLVIPATERSLIPLSRRRELFDGIVKIALPPQEPLEIVLDKSRTVELAEQIDVSAPWSKTVSDADELAVIAPSLKYPVVLKPARSFSEGGIHDRKQQTVTYAHNAKQLVQHGGELLQHVPVILQEYFVGEGVGVEIIARDGQILTAFQHRRIHEVPLSGGGSSLRVSEPPSPVLLDAARRLIAELDWQGVAMVEFREQPNSGDYRLMEINGRFWGSLPLGIAAGVDFPALLYGLEVAGETENVSRYRHGVLCRNLARDIYWHELVVRGADPHKLFSFPSKSTLVRDLLKLFSPRHCFDVQKWWDVRPGLIDLRRIIGGYISRLSDILRKKQLLRSNYRQWEKRQRQEAPSSSDRLLFLCYGNINRSALAETLLAKDVATAQRLTSAGFHEPDGRPADPNMVQVAAAHGIDMSGWLSRTVSQEMIGDADTIFVMDYSHLERIHRDFPTAVGKTFFLGYLAPEVVPDHQIRDPYGKDIEVYEQVFDQILACTQRLIVHQT